MMTTGFLFGIGQLEPVGKPSSKTGEAYREMIKLELSRGSNAMGFLFENTRLGMPPLDICAKNSSASSCAHAGADA
jgi:hypothetical protein